MCLLQYFNSPVVLNLTRCLLDNTFVGDRDEMLQQTEVLKWKNLEADFSYMYCKNKICCTLKAYTCSVIAYRYADILPSCEYRGEIHEA